MKAICKQTSCNDFLINTFRLNKARGYYSRVAERFLWTAAIIYISTKNLNTWLRSAAHCVHSKCRGKVAAKFLLETSITEFTSGLQDDNLYQIFGEIDKRCLN